MQPLLICSVILLPLLAGAAIPLFRFRSDRARSIYVEAVVLINSVLTALLILNADGKVHTLYTLMDRLDIAFRLKIDVQMRCSGNDRDAALCIVLVGDALLHSAASKTTTALAYFLFAHDNQFLLRHLGDGIIPSCTYYKFIHCTFSLILETRTRASNARCNANLHLII